MSSIEIEAKAPIIIYNTGYLNLFYDHEFPYSGSFTLSYLRGSIQNYKESMQVKSSMINRMNVISVSIEVSLN